MLAQALTNRSEKNHVADSCAKHPTEELEGNPDLVNQVLEITCAADASDIDILRYDLPSQN